MKVEIEIPQVIVDYCKNFCKSKEMSDEEIATLFKEYIIYRLGNEDYDEVEEGFAHWFIDEYDEDDEE